MLDTVKTEYIQHVLPFNIPARGSPAAHVPTHFSTVMAPPTASVTSISGDKAPAPPLDK